MFRVLFLFIAFSCSFSYSQVKVDTSSGELSLLFIGDIMGHGPQITSAYNKTTASYDYDNCFKYIVSARKLQVINKINSFEHIMSLNVLVKTSISLSFINFLLVDSIHKIKLCVNDSSNN